MPDVSSPVDPYRGNIDVGVVSVDLAYKDYRNVGIAVLTDAPDGISCEFVHLSIGGEPFPGDLARALGARKGTLVQMQLDGDGESE
jgi:hypothetical protein